MRFAGVLPADRTVEFAVATLTCQDLLTKIDLKTMLDSWPHVRWTHVLDILLVTALLWAAYSWLRRTRSRFVLIGMLLLSAVYLLARQLELHLTAWILQGFFAVLVFVLVVVFQDDLRRVFEQIAVWGLRRHPSAVSVDAFDMLIRTVEHQAEKRIGALYVIPGREPLDRHLEGGIELDARLSMPLLLSIFDHHSPGHDGAVVLSGPRVDRFAVHLPLSVERVVGGTRHAAALGLAERCDALVIAVSEERGRVSVAHGGSIRRLAAPGLLGAEIRSFPIEPAYPDSGRIRHPAQGTGEGHLDARLQAITGGQVVDHHLDLVDPLDVARARIDAVLVELGRRTFRITPANVELPAGAVAMAVEPRSVKLSVEKQPP